jgi:hypothetical protein
MQTFVQTCVDVARSLSGYYWRTHKTIFLSYNIMDLAAKTIIYHMQNGPKNGNWNGDIALVLPSFGAIEKPNRVCEKLPETGRTELDDVSIRRDELTKNGLARAIVWSISICSSLTH